ASAVYVRNKERACIETGIEPTQITLPEETTEAELISLIEKLNVDDSIHGILVQLPLPKHISEKKVIETIVSSKDVDAFSHDSVGRIMTGEYSFLPCTPAGIMELLKYYNIDVSGKECVVVGRSNIVGKPMAMLLLNSNGTVTVCHSRTQNLAEVCKRADIIVCAVGKAHFLKADMVKPGAVVIDVGINRTEEGKIVGDVDFAPVSKIASYITPVPGGVGPMTITMLLKNTLTAAKASK
ncbi:MAG: bifunctional 5,10-methylenetetrahydrofolate dehydrogenase/5,10-methenyltetrahydrofolate cyclohydrolase, partial [Oscillospiraceae bacterium]|nr:bifunctional 5,10-methylenetetrahydrofolate dehydrogenase/5,10-methenyltetrahydrofolate cyclohydrolase [Oscillospiraceae bacterium]